MSVPAVDSLTMNSSEYNISSERSLIREGPPAVYLLKPKQEIIGTLTKKTIGEKDVNKINKTILLVGETGTGKSTLINSLINYVIGVKFEDNIWFEIVEEESGQTESQTSDVIVYEIFGFEDKTLFYSLTIIDTPGYGDTRGIEKDLAISQRLFDLFSSNDGVHEINAVGLVMKATENRLNDRLRYVFDSVTSLFGKDLEESIAVLITHSDGTIGENVLKALQDVNIKCAKDEKKQPLHFVFNNCQRKQRTEETQVSLENTWKITMKGMDQFTKYLERCGPQRMKTTVKVLKLRIRLTACIQNLLERIKLIELKQNEIKQTQEALNKSDEEMKRNEIFEVDEVYKERQPINCGMWLLVFYQGAVVCTVCEENCHHPCSMAWSPKDCKVIKKHRCTSCTNKCPASAHVKDKWIYVTKTRKVQNTKETVGEKYEMSDETGRKLSFLDILEKDMKELTAKKNQLLEESYQHAVKLDEIALNADSLSTYVHLDFLIEKMKEKGDTEKIRKLVEMKSRVDEETITKLQHMFSK